MGAKKQFIRTSTTIENHSLHRAGLVYVPPDHEGYTRKRAGRNFVYLCKNKRIKTKKTLNRIQKLVIPPAWNDVWICQSEKGHLQATGRDARGRKQYLYHSAWTQLRNENKFESLLEFGKVLPQIRRQIKKDLSLPGLAKDKVLAAVVSVMQDTCIRIGNDIYAKTNSSYGLTTLLNKHVKVSGDSVRFQFRGKSGILHDASLRDKNLSRIVKKCQELPGKELFAYKDENQIVQDVTSTDVNEYLKKISGASITAKDFRTWVGTVVAIEEIANCGPLEKISPTAIKKRHSSIVRKVSEQLRNTVAVCRKYYIHPEVLESDEKGLICELLANANAYKKIRGLSAHENLLMALLKKSNG